MQRAALRAAADAQRLCRRDESNLIESAYANGVS